MTVLLGAVKKKYFFDEKKYSTDDLIWIHQYEDKKNSDKNKFYIEYKGNKKVVVEGNTYNKRVTITSPVFEGSYRDGEFVKPITAWIKSINGKPDAQYFRMYDSVNSISDFKRGYKAKTGKTIK